MAKTVETKELTEVSEAQIAVHWKEEEYYQPSEQFKAQANLRDPHVFAKFGLDKFPDCFKTYADMLTWFQPYHRPRYQRRAVLEMVCRGQDQRGVHLRVPPHGQVREHDSVYFRARTSI